MIVTLSSGNLSITQNAINMLEQQARGSDEPAETCGTRDVDVRRRAAARRLRCAR